MSKRLIIYLWIVAGTLCQSRVFSQQEKPASVLPPKDILWGGITGMSQDPQGFLWFATQSGLYKYDGHHYTGYKHEPSNPASIGSVALEDVFAGKDGTIWVATYGAGLDRLDPVTNIFTHYRHQAGVSGSLVDDKVSCLLADREGQLWIGTNSGLELFQPKTGTFKHFMHRANDPGSLSNDQVRIIYEDRQGTLWVGTGSVFPGETAKGEGGLNRLDKKTGKFTRYLHNPADPNSLTDNRIQAIFEDSRGMFWVGSAGDGLHSMDRAKGTFIHFYRDPQRPEKLSRSPLKKSFNWADDHITFINEDHSGKLWIGSFENGISVYDPVSKKSTWYGTDPNCDVRLTKNEFWRAFKTRDGELWLAPWQSDEFYKVSPYQGKVPYIPLGKTVMDFAEGGPNHLWIATTTGLIDQNRNNWSLKVIATDKNIPPAKDFINAVEKDGDDRLWLSTMHGLYRYDIKKKIFTAYHPVKGDLRSLPSDSMYGTKAVAGKKIWFAGQNGAGVLDIRTGLVRRFQNDPRDSTSLSNNLTYRVETDQQNRVWVATSFGFDRFDERTGHFKRYLKGLATNCTYKNSRGELWAGTDLGIFRYDPVKDLFSRVSGSEIQVYGLTQDQEGNLWSNMTQGIQKINLPSQEQLLYSTDQGVAPQALSGLAYTRPNGEVLIGHTNGYYSIDPVKLRHSTPPPSVIINQFLLADVLIFPTPNGPLNQPVFHTNGIRLNHNQSTFSFGFANIDYADATNNDQLYYMLQNYDTRWRKAGPDELAGYHSIPPGEYVFKVKSINVNGLTSEKQISLVILPPWWQTWWAIIFFVLLLAGATWSFVYYRSRSLLLEKRVLEQKVQLRTEEVMQQKVEIEAQRDDLSQALEELKNTQTQLVQREKMASLGELTAGIAHEIQNPLNFVNNFSEVSVELLAELKEEAEAGHTEDVIDIANDLTQNLQKINHHGKRADSIVKGMLEHSRVGTGEKQPTDLNALADEFLKLAYQGQRSKDKLFQAEIVTHYDPRLPKANIVQQDLGRVLINLFNNAFYAVHQQSGTAGEHYQPKVELTTIFKNGQIEISVRDNGNGIPAAIREKIMQPFFTTKPTGEGTGLGLSLSYDIVVKGHGGTIQVNSSEGQGSEFIVALPVN